MNKTHQKLVHRTISKLEELHSFLEAASSSIEERLEGRSSTYREGEKGQQEDEELSNLQEAISSIESALDSLSNIDTSETQ